MNFKNKPFLGTSADKTVVTTTVYFTMNGQTGNMVGVLPSDNNKYWLLTIAFIAGLAAVCFGLSFLIEIFANIIVSAIIALGGGFLITGIMRSQLKSVGFNSNATDENNYTPNEPFTVEISSNPNSAVNDGYMTLWLKSGGADSPRQFSLRMKGDGR